MIQWRAALAVAALFGAFAAGWYAQGLRWDADVLSREAAASAAQTEASNRAVAQMAAERIAAQQREADAIQHLARLQHENDDLRTRVDAGAIRLRVKATCPVCPPPVPYPASLDAPLPSLTETLNALISPIETPLQNGPPDSNSAGRK